MGTLVFVFFQGDLGAWVDLLGICGEAPSDARWLNDNVNCERKGEGEGGCEDSRMAGGSLLKGRKSSQFRCTCNLAGQGHRSPKLPLQSPTGSPEPRQRPQEQRSVNPIFDRISTFDLGQLIQFFCVSVSSFVEWGWLKYLRALPWKLSNIYEAVTILTPPGT